MDQWPGAEFNWPLLWLLRSRQLCLMASASGGWRHFKQGMLRAFYNFFVALPFRLPGSGVARRALRRPAWARSHARAWSAFYGDRVPPLAVSLLPAFCDSRLVHVTRAAALRHPASESAQAISAPSARSAQLPRSPLLGDVPLFSFVQDLESVSLLG